MRKRTLLSKNIAIFVAGSITLKSERDALKAMVLDLNSKSRIQRLGTHVDIKSYEDDFKNKQEEYNKFVQKTADLVFVLITDCIGDNTELELKTASESLCENGWPEVYVFIKDDNTLKDDDPRVMKMREYLGQDSYAIRFKDSDELKTEARKRIMQYVGVLYRFSRNVKKWILRILLFSLLLLVGFLVFSKCQKDRPIIMFAGGGSVAQFIKQNYHQDVQNIPNSVYARMPSSHAWTLLVEDIITPPSSEDDGAHRKFYPICLSAEAIPDTFFTNQCDKKLLDSRPVASYYLGEDNLVLYVEANYAKEMGWKNREGTIEVIDLVRMLRNIDKTKDVKFFSTSIGSGTQDLYQKLISYVDQRDQNNQKDKKDKNDQNDVLSIKDMMDNGKVTKYTELSLKTNDSAYVVMGSKYYFVVDTTNLNYHRLTLTLDDQVVSKGIYLYFNTSKGGDNMFDIPSEVVDVLVDYFHIDRDTAIWDKKLKKSEKGVYYVTNPNKDISVFVYLNERPKSLTKFWDNIDDSIKFYNEKIEEAKPAPK